MFLGAIEISYGTVYESENSLKSYFNNDNIVIIENDFIITDFITDNITIMCPVFYATAWYIAKKLSEKNIINALIFDSKTTTEEIHKLLKKRVKYIFKTYNINVNNLTIETIKSNMFVKYTHIK